MTQLKALIFDVDGTLADTERDGHRVAFNQAFAAENLDWCWSESLYGKLLDIAGGKERIDFYIQQYQPNFAAPQDLDNFLGTLHTLKNQYYQQLLATAAIPLRYGVKRLLHEAKSQNIRLAIATTSALPNVMALLEHTLESNYFELIAAGDIVAAKKPASDIYFYVLEKMGLTAKECMVFEDSENGLKAASGAGLPTIITVNGYTQNQDFSQACLVVNHLGEPHHPCQVLAGKMRDAENSYIDLSWIRSLHQKLMNA